MSDSWFERFRKYWFPTKEERYVDGINWAMGEIRDFTTACQVENWENMQPLCAADPFDRGVFKAVSAHLSKLAGKQEIVTLDRSVPEWARGPLPIAEEHLVLREEDKWPAPEPSGIATWGRVKPRVRVKAGRRVI